MTSMKQQSLPTASFFLLFAVLLSCSPLLAAAAAPNNINIEGNTATPPQARATEGPIEKSTGLPWIGDLTITFSDVSSVSLDSYGYLERERALGLITGDVGPVITVANWPSGEEQPILNIKALSLVPDNAAPELQQDTTVDAVHVAKAVDVLDICRQAALLAASNPEKYSLSIRVALRSTTNFIQNTSPSWPNMSFYISEEYSACRVFRK